MKSGDLEETISEDDVLECSGEDHLARVAQVIIRDAKFTGIRKSCAERLINLKILSLSHNCISDLLSFSPLVNLVELNLNFNRLTSLEGLACPRLKKLFLSSNRLQSTKGMAQFGALSTLSLYRNEISDLEATISDLKGLTMLCELDLAGNPCMGSPGYKHHLLRGLKIINLLDGDEVTDIDRDLAVLYFEQQGGEDTGKQRVFTATVQSMQRNNASRRLDVKEMVALSRLGTDAQLETTVASTSLSTNPVFLAYMAEDIMSTPRQSEGAPESAYSNPEDQEDGDVDEVGASQASFETWRGQMDPSDPYRTIQLLVQHIELLQGGKERGAEPVNLDSFGVSGGRLALSEAQHELHMLRVENANMALLQEENRTLRTELEKVRRRNAELEEKLEALSAIGDQSSLALSIDGMEDEVDEQLAELFKRNVQTMSELRRDMAILSADTA
jgi:hypothetical protein